MRNTLVVARYKEDISWLSGVSGFSRVVVYDKSGMGLGDISLPNVGRESHTYLTHIVENYSDLGDWVTFVQGNPFDHCSGIMEELGGVSWPMDRVRGFGVERDFWLGSTDHLEGGVRTRACCMVWPFIGSGSIPLDWPHVYGAQMVVHRSCILRHPVDFYRMLLAWHLTPQLSMPWGLEVCWHRIFSWGSWRYLL